MTWKRDVIRLTVLMVMAFSTSMGMDFCEGDVTVRQVDLVYKKTSEYKHCLCRVQHISPSSAKNYTVKRDGKGIKRLNISCGYIEPDYGTETTSVKIDQTSSETTSVTPSTSSPHLSDITSSQTIPISTILDEPLSSSQTKTSTMGAQVLPSTADKENDSTISITGGVLGGLLCIAVGLFIIFILRRRYNRKRDDTTSHDNPVYGAPGNDVIYDVANNVTDKSRDFHDTDLATDSNYFTLEDNGGNKGYSYINPSSVDQTDQNQGLDQSENENRFVEGEDCYNHTNIAAGSRGQSKGDNYVNVAPRTRKDYDHIKPKTGLSSGPFSKQFDEDDDCYNHTGQVPFQNIDPENCYHHTGQFSSQTTTNPEDCYNHTGQFSSKTMTYSDDCYNHIGQIPPPKKL